MELEGARLMDFRIFRGYESVEVFSFFLGDVP